MPAGMEKIRYLSVCSGIEAATVAWHPLGWRPVAFSVIEKFPSAVLAHHYPDVPNWGDMTKFQEWPDAIVDLLVGGTPCQSFSVAGLRQGLRDPRGNLALVYLALADRYRPRWLVWENVPGVLSSSRGRDFGSFLGGMAELGYGFAYRVLDAQHVRTRRFGRAVPQRRRRVFVVGYLGDWRRAASVLFEREGLSGNTPPRRGPQESLTRDVAPSLRAQSNCSLRDDSDAYVAVSSSGDVAHCLNAGGMGRQDYETETMIAQPYTLAIRGRGESHDLEYRQDGTANALLTPNGGRAGIGVGVVCAPIAFNSREDPEVTFDRSGPLGASSPQAQAIAQGWAVRRLTPTECERLQGFQDGYTNIPVGKKLAADGSRYKALGNSMAINCMRWIGMRIQMVDAL